MCLHSLMCNTHSLFTLKIEYYFDLLQTTPYVQYIYTGICKWKQTSTSVFKTVKVIV